MTLAEPDRQHLKNALHDHIGLDLTDAQLDEVVSDPRVHRELELGGVHDTLTQETAASFLAKKILGRSWPTYGEGLDEKFFEDFRVAAKAQGYSPT